MGQTSILSYHSPRLSVEDSPPILKASQGVGSFKELALQRRRRLPGVRVLLPWYKDWEAEGSSDQISGRGPPPLENIFDLPKYLVTFFANYLYLQTLSGERWAVGDGSQY